MSLYEFLFKSVNVQNLSKMRISKFGRELRVFIFLDLLARDDRTYMTKKNRMETDREPSLYDVKGIVRPQS